MATREDLRQIVARFPGTSESESGFGVDGGKGKVKGLAWIWLERVDPKKARVPNPDFWAVRVPSLAAKEVVLDSNPEIYFTEAHYNGYPAVLIRLALISTEELADRIEDAWRCQAPKALVRQFDAAP